MPEFFKYQNLDSEESVVAKVLGSLKGLAELGLFPRMRAWELMSATLALLYHPNIWIRQGKRFGRLIY
jgi:phosphoinositide-3-kinase, regulatory subunit 4